MTNKNKTWGGRFAKAQHPKVISFNASLGFDHVLFEYDIIGTQTHVTMLARQDIITAHEAKEICQALDEIRIELKQGNIAWDASHEDIHMFIEHLLLEKIGITAKKTHTGRSRNDQVALDLRLYARDAGEKVTLLLNDLIAVLQALQSKHAPDTMPGYTHLQQAQPIALGEYFAAYLAMFKRDKGRLADWHKRMNFSPLGACALAGSHLPLDRQFIADTLSFNGVMENTIDAVSDRDFVIEFCAVASIIMMHLSRLSEDLIVWSTQEFGFVTLDDAYATGSSLMPNKKNPDVLELIRGKSGRVFGHLMGILTVMKGLPLAYNKDMQEDKEGLFDTVKTLVACLEIISPFMQSLQFDTALMQQKAQAGYLDATKILEELVLQGIPFREAHHKVGMWVAEAEAKGISIRDVMKL